MSAVEKVKKSATEDAAVLKFREAYAEALAEARVSQPPPPPGGGA